ncbi:MAG: aldehyde dehydrogenase [Lachnospiraceae bacterium]|nr:aldehyde dehydrogenase [Lachnospiraceae bacterium]
MQEKEIKAIIDKQRNFFYSGVTQNVNYRIKALQRLKACIIEHETQINEAVKKDLGKSSFETYMCETGIVLSEIRYMLKHIRSFSADRRVSTPLAQFHAKSYKKPSPYGVVLIMSPWNYPFLLTIEPLIDALAAGNTAVLKPSAYSPHTSAVMKKIISKCFNPEYVALITGGRSENICLLKEHFDYIFFTGSQAVGREVMAGAAAYLTPVTLELGGKSPCIVEKSANIRLAAKRIVFGKFLNCGQTCVAPDYIYCDRQIKDELIHEIKKQIIRQFGSTPLTNGNYGKIVNEKHFNRILSLIDEQKTVFGGKSDRRRLKIEPTVMDNVVFEDAVMQEEIFGPILPVLTYTSLNDAVNKINSMAHPLALYLFTKDKQTIKRVMTKCGFGGGCINDTIIHLATSEMGFGGFGESGMGSYHGKDGFDTFSHFKSIVDKKNWFDLPIRYQPYKPIYEKFLHYFLK